MKSRQRGGFVVGLIVGLLIGVALSLGVALYVTKVPVPFINKVPQRSPEQDAAEVEKNRNWDPNSPLYGKNPARPSGTPPASTPSAPSTPAAALPPPVATTNPPATTASTPNRRDTRDPAAILADRPAPASAQPVAIATRPSADPFSYFVQAGAYGRTEDAEQQRAKLAMLGLTARVTEREQGGRTVYRVRVGPYERKEDADAAKDRLDSSSIEAALVRVQK